MPSPSLSTWQPPVILKSLSLSEGSLLGVMNVQGMKEILLFSCRDSTAVPHIPQVVLEPKVFPIISFKPYFTVTLIKI